MVYTNMRKSERRAQERRNNANGNSGAERRNDQRRISDRRITKEGNKRKRLIDRRQNERRKTDFPITTDNRRCLSKRADHRRREDLVDLEQHLLPISICGTGYYVPEQVITNNDYEKKYGVSAEWINKVSGIETRRKKSSLEDCAILGTKAARKALERANVSPKEIDLIILSSSAPNYLSPPLPVLYKIYWGLTTQLQWILMSPAWDLFGL